jgi:hypothetical protein
LLLGDCGGVLLDVSSVNAGEEYDDDDDEADDYLDSNYSVGESQNESSVEHQIQPIGRSKFSRQFISLLPSDGVRNVFDFTAHPHPKECRLPGIRNRNEVNIRYATGLKVDSLSMDDDSIYAVAGDNDDSGEGCSEVHTVDASFWDSSSCPNGLYLVAHTKDVAHVIEDCKQGQVYVFQQLTTITHLQIVRKFLGPYLRSTLSSHVPVHLYRNSCDHRNYFCVVLNTVDSVPPIIHLIDLMAMHQLLSNVDPKTMHGRLRQKDQT